MAKQLVSYRAALRLTTDPVSREELVQQVIADRRLTERERWVLVSFADSRRGAAYG